MKFLLIFWLLTLEVFSQPVLGPNNKDICVGMIIEAGGRPVDQALIKIYDKDHNFLCEKLSDTLLMGYNWIQDSLKIKEYGAYYIEVSKPGFRTLKSKIMLKDTTIQHIPEFNLLPKDAGDDRYGWLMAVLGAGLIVFLFFIWRKYKTKKQF